MRPMKTTREIFARSQNKKHLETNQPIYFQDLLIRNMNGERDNTLFALDFPPDIRLALHIHSLFDYVNELHSESYCEEIGKDHYRIKDEYTNHITRLLTSEFSFYSNDPLTLKQWNYLLQKIACNAQILLRNVHFLLSSFSVLDQNHQLHNVTIYVEAGPLPQLHVFSKNTASMFDWSYQATLFSQFEQGIAPIHHADYITSNDSMISTDSVFEVTTEGGAHYTQAIDICLDHASGHSKELFRRRLDDADSLLLIPDQIEHCVTSRTIGITPTNVISTHLLHVDPFSRINPSSIRKIEYFNQVQPNQSDDPSILFGDGFSIEILYERPAGRHHQHHQIDVDLHNKVVFNKQRQEKLSLTISPLFFSMKQKDVFYSKCESLIEQMRDFKLGPQDNVMEKYLIQLSSRIEKSDETNMSLILDDLNQRLLTIKEQAVIREIFFFYDNLAVYDRNEYDRLLKIKHWILDIPMEERHNDSFKSNFWLFEKNHYDLFIRQHKLIFLKIDQLHEYGLFSEEDWVHFHHALNQAITTCDLNHIKNELLIVRKIILIFIATKQLFVEMAPSIKLLEQLFQSIPMHRRGAIFWENSEVAAMFRYNLKINGFKWITSGDEFSLCLNKSLDCFLQTPPQSPSLDRSNTS
jgi:hypothetical protein